MKNRHYFGKFILYIAILTTIFTRDAVSQQDNGTERLFDMDLDELLNIEVLSGNITGLKHSRTPVSHTTITSDEIEMTPANNLYDLIEIYVPGAIWMNHHDSPHFGIRGVICDRNYKYLLLVNGRNMSMKAHNGISSELENHDMHDIEQIDIIRGPGSVTYGPGAVAGIINIRTKNADTDKGLEVNSIYNPTYNSYGGSLSYARRFGDIGLYLYGSAVRTEGISDFKAFKLWDNHLYGYFDEDWPADQRIQDYYRDYNDIPQLKFHTEINFPLGFNLRMRYTGSGATAYGVGVKSRPQTGLDSLGIPTLGDYENLKQTQNKHFTVTLEKSFDISDNLSMSTMLSWDNENAIRRRHYFEVYWEEFYPTEDIVKELADKDHIRNQYYEFSEKEFLARALANWKISNSIGLALGTEISHNTWGPGWGRDATEFRMGDKHNIISGPDSKVYGDGLYRTVSAEEAYFVGEGWSTTMYSIMAEAMLNVHEKLDILVSGRFDKDSYSKYLFSPRIAFISALDDRNILKLVTQQSRRMNTADQLLIQHMEGTESDPETLSSIELIYTRVESDNLLFNASAFYNHIEVLSWYDPERSTRLTGELQLYGIEFEVSYRSENLHIGANHSLAKQIDWQLADGVSTSGISYSDYYVPLDSTILSGVGNDLNNWPNHSTKAYLDVELFEKKFTLHADARVFWLFNGAKDGWQMIENAAYGNPDEAIILDIVKEVRDAGMYNMDFRLNIMADYKINRYFSFALGIQNLLGTGNNKRYTYEAGNKNRDYIARGGFLEEPLAVFARMKVKY